MTITDDPIYLEVREIVEGFRKRAINRIERSQQKQKACKIKNVIESKMAQELKINAELKARLAELSKRGDDLDRVCANFASGVTISDSDKSRLENAKEMVVIGKKLTGIRFDFSAPPNVVKGYIKSESRRALLPFEVDASSSETLWNLMQGSALDKENAPNN